MTWRRDLGQGLGGGGKHSVASASTKIMQKVGFFNCRDAFPYTPHTRSCCPWCCYYRHQPYLAATRWYAARGQRQHFPVLEVQLLRDSLLALAVLPSLLSAASPWHSSSSVTFCRGRCQMHKVLLDKACGWIPDRRAARGARWASLIVTVAE